MPPYGPPARRGDGRNMLRPYGLTRTYPSRQGERGWIPVFAGMTSYAKVSFRGNDGAGRGRQWLPADSYGLTLTLSFGFDTMARI